MNLLKAITVSALLTSVAACSSTPSSDTGGGDLAAQLESTAAKYAELDKLGAAWRDTKEMLDDAKKALTANDSATAAKLLDAAKHEVEMAKAQFEQQKNAGPYLF